MNWIRLTPQQARSLYGIPPETANAAENTFFGTPINLPYEFDVPRPLVALLRSRERPDVVTLHIQTIHPETWEYRGVLPNPLTVAGGYLSLDKEGLAGLIAILSSYQEQLPPGAREDRQMFGRIEDAKLADFRLHPEWFPKSRQEHYIQVHDPLVGPDGAPVVTILILSGQAGFSTATLQVRQFPSQALQDPDFKPLDQALARVNLDRNGMQEFASLLSTQMGYLNNANLLATCPSE